MPKASQGLLSLLLHKSISAHCKRKYAGDCIWTSKSPQEPRRGVPPFSGDQPWVAVFFIKQILSPRIQQNPERHDPTLNFLDPKKKKHPRIKQGYEDAKLQHDQLVAKGFRPLPNAPLTTWPGSPTFRRGHFACVHGKPRAFWGYLPHSFQGSFFLEHLRKPRETAGFWKERWLKRMGNQPPEACPTPQGFTMNGSCSIHSTPEGCRFLATVGSDSSF